MKKGKLVIIFVMAIIFLVGNHALISPVKAETKIGVLSDFAKEDVVITNDYYENALALEVSYLKSLNADRLLAGFLETNGLIAKAPKYPGWENTEIRGHTLGHYLSAISQAYVNTKDSELLVKINYIVDELERSQMENGYLAAFPERYYDNVEQNKPCWVPWYTMHKIINGLLDVYKNTGNEKALIIVTKLGDWVYNRTSEWTTQTQNTVLAVEYGGMNDCLYELYKITGNEKHAVAAHKFDEVNLFTSLQQGKDVLNGKHANTTIPKFIGALNRYLALGTGEELYLEAAQNFWQIVVDNHTYITGGNSELEHFGPANVLDVERTNCNNETCNTYNMLKLTRELFKLTGDVKYADYYENTFINSIMSSQNPETGMTMYFQPMDTGYFKVYSSEFNHFWCCTGTGMENFSKLNDSIYFHSATDIYVNQYLSSEVIWDEMNLRLIQETDIPNTDTVKFTVATLDNTTSKAVFRFRIPDWIAGEPTVTVNGAAIAATIENNYLVLSNTWADKDVIELTLPMKVVAYNLPDGKNTIAFKYGPVVLSAALGTEGMIPGKTGVDVSIPNSINVDDMITVSTGSVKDWLANINDNIVKSVDKLEFKLLNTDADDLVFTPHYLQYKERYGIYWNFDGVDALDSEEAQAKILEAKEKARLDNITLDSLPIGNDQYEAQHDIQGQATTTGPFKGSTYRDATANGWFSYELKVDPNAKNYLAVTYYSGDAGRTFNIYINDTLLVEETLKNPDPDNFYIKTYELPTEMITGKTQVTVKFATRGASFAGGIFDTLRMITDYSTNPGLKDLSFDIGELSEQFNNSVTEYTLTVPMDAEKVSMNAVLSDANGLLYVGDILVDDTVPRVIILEGDTTEITLNSKAEDHQAELKYTVKIIKSDVVESMQSDPSNIDGNQLAAANSTNEEQLADANNSGAIVFIMVSVILIVIAGFVIYRKLNVKTKK